MSIIHHHQQHGGCLEHQPHLWLEFASCFSVEVITHELTVRTMHSNILDLLSAFPFRCKCDEGPGMNNQPFLQPFTILILHLFLIIIIIIIISTKEEKLLYHIDERNSYSNIYNK